MEILKDFKQKNGMQICNWECHSESSLPTNGTGLGKMSASLSGGLQFIMC